VTNLDIAEFQEMMKHLYIHRDKKRGVKGTYEWLVDEVNELGEALQEQKREETEREIADVMAWLSSLANLLGIDLEKAALNKYPHFCPKCEKAPCQCTF
jgi:NTP pyrophosphatase (non-canonical NTP hydrolase)